ncbi:MAG: hypothetical protein VX871_10515 [Pseudomonadota bacterium]|nr:hypothetical protein [Pseudomonadota bacterium]
MLQSDKKSSEWPIRDDFQWAVARLIQLSIEFWWMIALAVGIGFFIGLIVTRLTPPYYNATAEIAPATYSTSSNPTSSALSGLAAITGISIGGSDQPVPKFVRLQELIKSVGFADRMQHETHMMEALFGPLWDEEKGQWEPGVSRASLAGGIKSIFTGRASNNLPGPVEIAGTIEKRVKLSQGREKIVTVSFRHEDPVVGAQFVGDLIVLADQMLKEEVRTQANLYISFINERLKSVMTTEHRRVLADLLSEFERQAMLAGAKDVPYAAIIIDPPFPPVEPAGPRPVLLVGISVLICLALAIASAVVYAWWQRVFEKVRRVRRVGATQVGNW